MANLKIALLGSGSLYFARVLPDLVASAELHGSEIALYDIDGEKSTRMAALATRLAVEAGGCFTVRSAATLAEAVDGARFALSSIGGSGADISPEVYASHYHGCDLAIPARYGIYQVVGDTAGPAGMMMGLRAVPPHLEIRREMERRCRGRDLYAELLRRTAEERDAHGVKLSSRLSAVHGRQIVYPEDDHIWEFYPFAAAVGSYERLPYDLRGAADRFGGAASRPPPVRGEGIGDLLSAIACGRRELAIVNLPNDGVVGNLSREAIVEVEGPTDSRGVRGILSHDAPPALRGLLEKRFAWHELVVEAAVTGDRRTALEALRIDEMAIPPDQAERMRDELPAASRDLLPRFFEG